MAAGGTVSTWVVTMRPIAIAKSAAKMICHTEPGALTRCQKVCFSGCATCMPGPGGTLVVWVEGESVEASRDLLVSLTSSISPILRSYSKRRGTGSEVTKVRDPVAGTSRASRHFIPTHATTKSRGRQTGDSSLVLMYDNVISKLPAFWHQDLCLELLAVLATSALREGCKQKHVPSSDSSP
jgi:hypothetical protein